MRRWTTRQRYALTRTLSIGVSASNVSGCTEKYTVLPSAATAPKQVYLSARALLGSRSQSTCGGGEDGRGRIVAREQVTSCSAVHVARMTCLASHTHSRKRARTPDRQYETIGRADVEESTSNGRRANKRWAKGTYGSTACRAARPSAHLCDMRPTPGGVVTEYVHVGAKFALNAYIVVPAAK